MNPTEKKIRIAILDMNAEHANQGMRCIREIINTWSDQNSFDVEFEEFEVRVKLQVPDTSFDIYISSGGPGSPLESIGSEWEEKFFGWLNEIEKWNSSTLHEPKHVFFICHSFQLACRHYAIGNVAPRKSTAFGVFPVHMIDGNDEVVFDGLREPFYAVDSRDFQVIQPNYDKLREMGAKLLAIEKNRPHVPFERAIMAVRFNDYFVGTQFHPEADATGMSMHLQKEDKKEIVIKNHGEEKWKSMIEQLADPDKISWTYAHILPNFLNNAVGELVA